MQLSHFDRDISSHVMELFPIPGKRDDLQNPSACLIAGKLVKVGTELFDCFAAPPLQNNGHVKRNLGLLSKTRDSTYDRIHTTGVKKTRSSFMNGNENGYDPYSYLSTKKSVKREPVLNVGT